MDEIVKYMSQMVI